MAQKKATPKNDKGFEESLWDSANRLRGSIESSEYKHVVLSLIFLKFVSDKFEERRADLMAEGKEKYTDMVEFYTMKNVFYLPETSRWSYIQQHAKQGDIAIKIDSALTAVEKSNASLKGVDFSKQFKALVDKYNDRSEQDILRSEVLETFTDEIIDLYHAMKKEKDSFVELGIDFEEKAFYDILKALAIKYDFQYPEDKLVELAKKVKVIVDDKAKYTDWSQRVDIKAELKADLIILLAESGYPPVDRDEVYKEIFEQAENFKKRRPV